MHLERLLRPDEPYGLCQVPVQICSLLDIGAWKALAERYAIRSLQGMAYLIEDACVVGIKRDETNRGTEISALYQVLGSEDSILSGPLISVDEHCYGLAIPAAAEVVIHNWEVLLGVIDDPKGCTSRCETEG